MKHWRWDVKLGVILVLLSALLYAGHYVVFEDQHHIFIYMVGDIAFVPIEVLLITMILHRVLERREKQAMLKKMNMAIGAFFSEVGTPLVKHLDHFDTQADELARRMIVENEWTDADFAQVEADLRRHSYAIDSGRGDLAALREFLAQRRQFLLSLLGNPNLLEHESFADLLWAVFHLTEELVSRSDLSQSPESDLRHLGGDIARAYRSLLLEWLAYMKHLRDDYPYLFSLAARTNPFNPAATAEVMA
jgi:hypothetical protein